MKAPAPKGRTRKHAGGKKHARTAKHAPGHVVLPGHMAGGGGGAPVHVVAKPPSVPKARKLSPGSVDLCPAEAVAQCARLAGWAVSAEDVLDLYARCATGPGSGFTIAAALTAGIAGWRPAFEEVEAEGVPSVTNSEMGLMETFPGQRAAPVALLRRDATIKGGRPTYILGVDLPGPHAVTVAPDGTWWSWGEPFRPGDWPEMVVEEAWAVAVGSPPPDRSYDEAPREVADHSGDDYQHLEGRAHGPILGAVAA